jgi:pimeloyl-ACP methyl ester carboxylesterase
MMIRLRASLLASSLLLCGTPLAAQAPAPAAVPAAVTLATVPDQQFTAGDVTLRYRDAGSGVPVVFIHGYSASLESMIGVSRALPDTYRKIAVDVRGFGRSSKFGEPARFGQLMVDDVIKLMDHLKIERAHLVGHSMGALIAANLVARYPARVMSASLLAGPFYPDEATFKGETARWVADLESGAGLTNFLKWLLPAMKPEMAGMANAQSMKANDLPSLIAVLKSLPALALAGLKTNGDKTVLVAGTGDPLFPLSVALSKQTPGTRLVEVAGGDHVNVLTNPAAATAITELVRR